MLRRRNPDLDPAVGCLFGLALTMLVIAAITFLIMGTR